MSIAFTPQDRWVRDAVLQQLEWDAEVEAGAIGVTAKDGIVTLTGVVDSCAGKLAAERAARRVRGVKGVANDIDVRMRLPRTDTDIAADAVRALERHGVLTDGVQVVVHHGHVTLTGAVRTMGDRAAAEKALRHTRGLNGVVNHIRIVPAPPFSVRTDARTLHCSASSPDLGIEVTVADDRITLTGRVRSWSERESAEQAAIRGRGITEVVNQIVVAPPDGMP